GRPRCRSPPTAPAPAPAAQPAPPQQAAPPQAPQPQAQQGGAGQIRQMWPQILDAVKGRRRVTWMLVQQAQVAGFDGSTLQLSFEHAGTRDGFVNGGHDEILRQALQDSFGMSWRIDCIIDPSVGRGPAPGSGPGQAAPQPMQQGAPQPPQQQYQAPPTQQFAPPPTQMTQSAPPVLQPSAPAQAPAQPSSSPQPSAPAPDPHPHPLSPDDETIPEEEAGYGQGMVSGPELIMKELGATVIQEIEHDR
ncbi:DNA polymerase III subunit gamma and tau, partial [Streptacidiphilus sp. N1-10]